MFGSNTRTGKSFFADNQEYQKGKLMVTSMFYTLQGEGRYANRPAVFVRLSKCHLACTFCLPAVVSTEVQGTVKNKRLMEIHRGDSILDSDAEGNKKFTKVLSSEGLLVPISDMRFVEFKDSTGATHTLITHKDHQFGSTDETFVSVLQLQSGDYDTESRFVSTWGPLTFVSAQDVPSSELRKLRGNERAARMGYMHSNPDKILITALKTESGTYSARGIFHHNCDTFFDDGSWMTVEEIHKRVRELHPEGVQPIIVVTGGEPLLQSENLEALVQELRLYKITMETTGTYAPLLAPKVPIHYTVSPKVVKEKHLKIHPLWSQYHEWDFKFVVDSEDPVYKDIPSFVSEYGVNVYVSPMNKYKWAEERIMVLNKKFKGEVDGPVLSQWDTNGPLDQVANQKNHQYAAQLCLKHGYWLSIQTHLFTALP